MADGTGIEWTDATWNPLRGCTRVSEGCRFCYAEGVAARFSGPGQPYEGLAKRVGVDPRWTGKIVLVDHMLEQPLRWARPRRIFVNSMSDLFHENVPDEWIDKVFAVMAQCPQHTFQVLTKRPERMWQYLRPNGPAVEAAERWYAQSILRFGASTWWAHGAPDRLLHLPNVQMGISIENQAAANERMEFLHNTPAAVRFISAEPLLGPLELELPRPADRCDGNIHWVICGGESGAKARPMHPAWARSLRDQCAGANVPFFFKQWGEWAPRRWKADGGTHAMHRNAPTYGVFQELRHAPNSIERAAEAGDGWQAFERVGKKAAGRLLDGITHDAFPSPSPALRERAGVRAAG